MTIKRIQIIKRKMFFAFEAKTSRNVLRDKTSYFLIIENKDGKKGIGECAPIYGLSLETEEKLESKLEELTRHVELQHDITSFDSSGFPALLFALECAEVSLRNNHPFELFENDFSQGKTSIVINGLIWMSSLDDMQRQLEEKVKNGFDCIKIKIGAHNFNEELKFLDQLRSSYGSEIELRLDANGAFKPEDASFKLHELAEFSIHSIEQPIMAGQIEQMAEICQSTPIPVALDEELIGVYDKGQLLERIRPQFIILKPTLLGGFRHCDEWIDIAESTNCGWWATSALESNIGLNAIAQWVANKNSKMYQGLGTGQIFNNNVESPLILEGQELRFDNRASYNFETLAL